MAFRFRLDESVEKGFRRIVQEQLERAEQQLLATGDRPETVHEVRKSLKRVRALVRLVRPGLGDDVFKAENARLRDAGRRLAGARDRYVMHETLGDLELVHGLDPKIAGQVRSAIARPSVNGTASPSAAEVSAEAARLIGQGRRALKRAPLDGEGLDVVVAGLTTSIRRCRRTFRAAYLAQSDEAFHEWRKTLQHHWRHMNLMSAAWPELMAARAGVARDLSQLIGTDHDYGVLAAFSEAEASIERRAARDLVRLCRSRQKAIRTTAEPMGERLLAEGAETLARRIGQYWTTAQRIEAGASAAALPDPKDASRPAETKRRRPGRAAPRTRSRKAAPAAA